MSDLLILLDYFGIVTFAITGCLLAARRKVDIVGFTLLGIVTAIGGGTLRDVILDRTPVFWVQEPIYLYLCLATALVTFFAAHWINRYMRWVLWADAVGLAVFAAIGTKIGILSGAGFAVCVLMGVITATFGGIVRDLLAGVPTLVLHKEIYVTAAFSGACVFWVFSQTDMPENIIFTISFVTTFLIRALALVYRLKLPGYRWYDRRPVED